MVEPQPAAVRPRVTMDDATDALVLEDEVRSLLDTGKTGLIEIVGVPGSGKSTAIAHLAHVFADVPNLLLADRPGAAEAFGFIKKSERQLVICASAGRLPKGTDYWWLAPWTRDECLEYLLAVHRQRCAAVLARVAADPQSSSVGRLPELWRIVLDRLATDDRLTSAKSALREEVYSRLPTVEARSAARECSWTSICQPELAESSLESLCRGAADARARCLLRHVEVQMLLAAEHLAAHLLADPDLELLNRRIPESLVRETAELISTNTLIIERLRDILDGSHELPQPMAASLLHFAGHDARPLDGRKPLLAGAYLAGVRWPELRQQYVDWTETDLSHAELSGAVLESVIAHKVQLAGAQLRGARLKMFSPIAATLTRADLSGMHAVSSDFSAANLHASNMEGANLTSSIFIQADLSGAHCARANFSFAGLVEASIEGADFADANFEQAILCRLPLRTANFSGARFVHALLTDCDLEYMSLPAANFEQARLAGAHLTGSHMPGATFRAADLRSTGLAEIDWEGVDLRDADLRRSTFHLGSTRSGLVGSPIACEGSRTGFYTDDYQDQEFKSPEEIRKANLRGADLRGAKIDGVDFYLVDLRDALYTRRQADHFRRCGAILEARVC